MALNHVSHCQRIKVCRQCRIVTSMVNIEILEVFVLMGTSESGGKRIVYAMPADHQSPESRLKSIGWL